MEGDILPPISPLIVLGNAKVCQSGRRTDDGPTGVSDISAEIYEAGN